MDLVSVYLITQNRSALLKRAVDSVLSQDYSSVELIIVDDASTDDTHDVVEPYLAYDNVKYLRNDSVMGACFSRNRAIELASGVYITGLDDDDFFEEQRISKLVEAYDDKYAFVCSNVFELSPRQESCKVIRSFGFKSGEFGLTDLLHSNIVGNQVLTKKSKLVEVGAFDPEMPAFQDYDTWVRLLSAFPKALKIQDATYVLETHHGGQRISSNSQKKYNGFKRFMEKHGALMNKKHMQSMLILETKVLGSQYDLLAFTSTVNNCNYKSAISLYLSINLKWFKSILDSFKGG